MVSAIAAALKCSWPFWDFYPFDHSECHKILIALNWCTILQILSQLMIVFGPHLHCDPDTTNNLIPTEKAKGLGFQKTMGLA